MLSRDHIYKYISVNLNKPLENGFSDKNHSVRAWVSFDLINQVQIITLWLKIT